MVIAISGDKGTYKLLILSQVVLSLQLPFAIVPLVHFTSDKLKMGSFYSKLWVKVLAWLTSVIIIALNGKLVFDQITDWIEGGAPLFISILTIGTAAVLLLFLLYIIFLPLIRGQRVLERREGIRRFGGHRGDRNLSFKTYCSRIGAR